MALTHSSILVLPKASCGCALKGVRSASMPSEAAASVVRRQRRALQVRASAASFSDRGNHQNADEQKRAASPSAASLGGATQAPLFNYAPPSNYRNVTEDAWSATRMPIPDRNAHPGMEDVSRANVRVIGVGDGKQFPFILESV